MSRLCRAQSAVSTLSKALCCVVFVPALAAVCAAKEWRGIVPLRSTRADVDRLLGQPFRQSPADASYDVKDARVLVTFSEGVCNKWPFDWDVPAGTVEEIHVYPGEDLPLSELKLDKRFREALDAHHGSIRYMDEEAGFHVVSHESDRKVHIFSHYPAAADRQKHTRCYDNIRGLPKGRPRAAYDQVFDSYGYVGADEEHQHLDNFAQALLRDANTEGYVFGYAGERAYKDEGRLRAERAKGYVVEKYGVKAERIWAVDAGHKKHHAAELYVLPLGGPVPSPFPDIRPSSVQLIDGGPGKQTSQQTSQGRP